MCYHASVMPRFDGAATWKERVVKFDRSGKQNRDPDHDLYETGYKSRQAGTSQKNSHEIKLHAAGFGEGLLLKNKTNCKTTERKLSTMV